MRAVKCWSAGVAIGFLGTSLTAFSAHAATNTHSFRSEPSLEPPRVTITHRAEQVAPGLLIVANFDFQSVRQQKPATTQSGPLILDNSGQPVWYLPIAADRHAFNTRVQTLARRPVLTWWEGNLSPVGTPTSGVFRIVGRDYRPVSGYVRSITGANGWVLSPHEFLITRRGTALATAYKVVGGQNLTAFGGSANGSVWDNAIHEYDLKTGRLVYEWNMLGRLPLSDSKTRPVGNAPWDAYHINSIDEDAAGNFLISNRSSWSIHKVLRSSGAVQWTLGGNSSSFALGPNAQFAFQHDARFQSEDRVSLFDNECCAFRPDGSVAPPVYQPVSRGLVLRLDHNAKTANLVRQYTSPGRVSGTQANTQLLANGNVLVGWGQQPFLSEFSQAGRLLFELQFRGTAISYRALRQRWTGRPRRRPAVAARRVGGRTRLYVSWNGATDVAFWQVLAGRSGRELRPIGRRVRRTGFETRINVTSRQRVFGVRALSRRGRVLGRTQLVRRSQGTTRFRYSPDY